MFSFPKLSIGNSKNNTLNGSSGKDLMFGKGGNDVINGGAGNDLIVGGKGNDIMTGGTGNDTFFFDNSKQTGSDTITDFGFGDRIVTTRKIYDSNDDGVILFGADKRLDLFGNVDGANDVAITGTDGKAITSLVLADSWTICGVTFYSYTLADPLP